MKAFEEVKPNLIITVPLVIEKIYKNIIQPLINKKGMKWALNIPLLDTQIYNQIRKRLIDALGGRFKEIIIGGAALGEEKKYTTLIKNLISHCLGDCRMGPPGPPVPPGEVFSSPLLKDFGYNGSTYL